MDIDVSTLEADAADDASFEVAWRYGRGHPDGAADALAERVAVVLARNYEVQLGEVPAFAVGPVRLAGVGVEVGPDGPALAGPLEVDLTLAAADVGSESASETARAAVVDWLSEVCMDLEVERDATVHIDRVAHGAQAGPDVVVAAGHAPLSPLEATVYRVERYLASKAVRASRPAVTEDTRVIGRRTRGRVSVDIETRLLSARLDGAEHYGYVVDGLSQVAENVAKRNSAAPVSLAVNTADTPLLSVTGCGAERGLIGVSGRSGGIYGVLSPLRPAPSLNPHGLGPMAVDKVYEVAAALVCSDLIEEFDEVQSVACRLLGRRSAGLGAPDAVELRVAHARPRRLRRMRSELQRAAARRLERMGELGRDLLDGHVAIGRHPLIEPGGRGVRRSLDWARFRDAMLARIDDELRMTAAQTGVATLSPAVIEAVTHVPRHEFVPEAHRRAAYRDRPLEIGHGQTISQPFIVALMTELASVGPGSRVLEVGTGSGYQTAVLAEMGATVHTTEIVEALLRGANSRLASFGYRNVVTRYGDGREGWAEHAPYDAIVVSAAGPSVPAALVEQLAPGGRLVLPVGPADGMQRLIVVAKDGDGSVTETDVLPVSFVPLTGE